MFENMDYTAARFWFDIGQTAVTVAIGIYVWWINRKAALEKRINDIKAALDNRCQSRGSRIEKLETAGIGIRAELANMPKSEEFRNLTNEMSRLNGRLEGINRAVDLINEFLIKQGGKGGA